MNHRVVELVGSSEFVPAAIQTLKEWRYVPRYIDGKAVESYDIQSTFRFELYGDEFPPSSYDDLGWIEPGLEPGQPQRDP